VGLERILLDHSQVCITNRVVVLHEFVKFLESGVIEPVHKILSLLKLVRSEVNFTDNFRIFNCLYLLFDICCVTKHTIFHLLELVYCLLALADVLHDRQREPIVVTGSLFHLEVQLTQHSQKQLLFNWFESTESAVIISEKLVELVNVAHVIILLEGNIDDCWWYILTDAVKELGLTDDYLQFRVEVHLEPGSSISLPAPENVA
jgi:hypothetical protein